MAGFGMVRQLLAVQGVIGYMPQRLSAGVRSLSLAVIIVCLVKSRERFMGVGQVLTMPPACMTARPRRTTIGQ